MLMSIGECLFCSTTIVFRFHYFSISIVVNGLSLIKFFFFIVSFMSLVFHPSNGRAIADERKKKNISQSYNLAKIIETKF